MSRDDQTTGSFAGSVSGLPVEDARAVDAACDAFEAKWRAGGRPDVWAALQEVPEPVRPAALRELVQLDLYYRRRDGATPTAADYTDRFPDLDAVWLAGVIDASESATAPHLGNTPVGPSVRYFGDYELLGEIAHGGMGVVYRARQVSLDRVVALKMIRSGEFAKPVEARRFRQEVEAAAALDHANVVPVYEVGEHQGLQYFAMRLVEGGTLAGKVDALGVPGAKTRADARRRQVAIARLVATVARAVHHAHQRGVLHRDLKPSNILLDGAGEPHVADFGLARRIGTDSSLTAAGTGVGTPAYMAPEQARGGKEITTQADVYGVGAVLYELLTGRPPFKGKDQFDTLRLVQETEAARPRAVCPAVDRDLETVCLKCLDKDAGKRYPSADALADDLDRWLRGVPIRARRAGAAERAVKWARRNPAAAGLAFVSLLALLTTAGGGVALGYSRTLEGANRALVGANTAAEALRGEAEEQRKEADLQRARARDEEARALRYLYVSRMTLVRQAERENDPGRVVRYLRSVIPQHPGQADVRGFEWHHLWRKYHGETTRVQAHTGPATGIDYSPDGQLVASAGSDGAVVVWDAATGREVRRMAGHAGRACGVAFGGRGELLVSGGADGAVIVWEVTTGREVRTLPHPEPVVAVAFAREGRAFGYGSGTKATMHDLGSDRQLAPVEHKHPVTAVALSPDGRRFGSTSLGGQAGAPGTTSGAAEILDRSAQEITPVGGSGGHLAVAFSTDGARVAVGNAVFNGKHTVTMKYLASGGAAVTLEGHENAVTGIAFAPAGGLVATCSLDRTIRVWNAATGREIHVFCDETPLSAVAFSPDGKTVASASDDGVLRFWVLPQSPVRAFRDGGRVLSLSFSGDGKRLAVNNNLYEMPAGTGLGPLPGGQGNLVRPALSPDGQRLAPRPGKGSLLASGAFTRDGRYATAGDVVWDVTADREAFKIAKPIRWGFVAACAFHPGGKLLAVGGFSDVWMRPGWLQLWEVPAGRVVRTFDDIRYNVFATAFSPDGRHLAAAVSEPRVAGKGVRIPADVRIWDVGSGKIVLTLRDHPDGIWGISFSPDGRRLAAAGNKPSTKEFPGSVRVWDLATGEEVWEHVGKPGDANTVAFSPCGRFLLTGGDDGMVTVFDGTPSAENPTYRPLPEEFEARPEIGVRP